MNNEIKIKFPGQILDYVDTKAHLLKLYNYINNLQEENKKLKEELKDIKITEELERKY